MKRFRPSIAGLMALIAYAATAFAAIRGSTALWATITFTIALVALSLALLGALYCRRPARIAWTGFAAFGWAYLAMTFGPWPNKNGVTVPPFPTMLAYEPLKGLIQDPGPATKLDDEPHAEQLFEIDRIPSSTYYAGHAPIGWTIVETGPPAPANDPWLEQAIRMGTADQPTIMGGGNGTPLPPGTVAAKPHVMNMMQLRRILHAIGAIAFAAIGGIAGRIFAACIDPARGSPAGEPQRATPSEKEPACSPP